MDYVERITRCTVPWDSSRESATNCLSSLPLNPISSNHEVLSCILQHSSTKELLIMHLVSSEARSLAAPLLYGSIKLTHPNQILLLHRTLIQNRRLALLVKRIIFLKDNIFLFSSSLSNQVGSGTVYCHYSFLDAMALTYLATFTLSFPNSNGLHKISNIDAPIPGTVPHRGFLPFLVLEKPISHPPLEQSSDSDKVHLEGMPSGYTMKHLHPTELNIPARYRAISNTELQRSRQDFPSDYSTGYGELKLRPYRFSFLHRMGIHVDPFLEYYLHFPDTLDIDRYTDLGVQRLLGHRWLPGSAKVLLLIPDGIFWFISYLLGRILSFLVYAFPRIREIRWR